MRILVDLPENQLRELREIATESGKSRAELVRRAVAAYLGEKRAPLSAYFGLWSGDLKEDPVEYQRRMRDEW